MSQAPVALSRADRFRPNPTEMTATSLERPHLAHLLVVLTAVLGLFVVTSTAFARPKLLDDKAGCERWLGTAAGNDPSVRVNLRLCPKDGGVEGELQWSSLQSGWNLRRVVGR